MSKKVFLLACVAVALSLGAASRPPAINTLVYSEKHISMSSATTNITVPEGEFWDVKEVLPVEGVTPTRLNIGVEEGAMVHFGADSFVAKPGQLQFNGKGWFLLDGDPYPATPIYYGGNFWVTNNTTFGKAISAKEASGDVHPELTICVEKDATLTMTTQGGVIIKGSYLTKLGEGTVSFGGAKGPSCFGNTDVSTSGRLIVAEGVVDYSNMSTENFFCSTVSSNWTMCVEVHENALLRFGYCSPDIRNLVLRGGRIESSRTGTISTYVSSILIDNDITVLPSTIPSVIDAETVGLSCIVGVTNKLTVAKGASLKITGVLKPGYDPDTRAVNGAQSLLKFGTGKFDIVGADKRVTILLPTFLEEAAVWIDAFDISGYADGENVNLIYNKGTAGGFFKNFIKAEVGCTDKTSLLYHNGQMPGPEYDVDGINGHPALRFCLTNALYTTAYKNIGGNEMTVFCVSSYPPAHCINNGEEVDVNGGYGLTELTYNNSPIDTRADNLLFMGDTFVRFSSSDRISVGQFAGGDIAEPRVSVATRDGDVAAFKMFGTDAQGVLSGTKDPLVSNHSNRVDIVVFGGALSGSLKMGPWCSTTSDGQIDYVSGGHRMATGELGEYIVFDRKLSAPEESLVTSYLRRKWLSSSVEMPEGETSAGSITFDVAAGETERFDFGVGLYSPSVNFSQFGANVLPCVEKEGQGALVVDLPQDSDSLSISVKAGAFEFASGVGTQSRLQASDGTTIRSTVIGPVSLAALDLGNQVTLERNMPTREAATFKMFNVMGLFEIGNAPSLALERKPKGVADFISYVELNAADSLEWNISTKFRGPCVVVDERANKLFKIDATQGLFLNLR